MTLRVCHLISGDLWAGAEAMAFNLLRGLNTLPGIELLVIVLNKGRLADQLQNEAIPTYILDEDKRSFPEIAWLASRAARKWQPEILHSHRYKENILSYLISLRLREDAALISTQHGMPELYDGSPSVLQRLKWHANHRLLATKFDRIIAVSADIKESLVREYGFEERNLEIIHNGVVIPSRADRVNGNSGFVIGSAGRFVPVKDYRLMVEVAREVKARTDQVRFEVAGDGPEFRFVQDLVHRHGLDQRFLLRGPIRDIAAFYQGLDVFLNTSIHEGIPLTVLEAMAHGVPPVVPRVGGLDEIVTNGVDGYLVDTRNPIDFATKCLNLHDDESMRRRMAQAARKKIVEQFSVERMVNAYRDMYLRALATGGQRGH
jgi:L-malate glycosyltransferase